MPSASDTLPLVERSYNPDEAFHYKKQTIEPIPMGRRLFFRGCRTFLQFVTGSVSFYFLLSIIFASNPLSLGVMLGTSIAIGVLYAIKSWRTAKRSLALEQSYRLKLFENMHKTRQLRESVEELRRSVQYVNQQIDALTPGHFVPLYPANEPIFKPPPGPALLEPPPKTWFQSAWRGVKKGLSRGQVFMNGATAGATLAWEGLEALSLKMTLGLVTLITLPIAIIHYAVEHIANRNQRLNVMRLQDLEQKSNHTVTCLALSEVHLQDKLKSRSNVRDRLVHTRLLMDAAPIVKRPRFLYDSIRQAAPDESNEKSPLESPVPRSAPPKMKLG